MEKENKLTPGGVALILLGAYAAVITVAYAYLTGHTHGVSEEHARMLAELGKK